MVYSRTLAATMIKLDLQPGDKAILSDLAMFKKGTKGPWSDDKLLGPRMEVTVPPFPQMTTWTTR